MNKIRDVQIEPWLIVEEKEVFVGELAQNVAAKFTKIKINELKVFILLPIVVVHRTFWFGRNSSRDSAESCFQIFCRTEFRPNRISII